MTLTLRGVADPDRFRVDINRARYYRDPLPACEIAEATDDTWPAITTVKKAWSHEFTKKLPTGIVVPLDGLRCARYVADNLEHLRHLDPDALIETVALAPKRDLNRAGKRGSDVHHLIEQLTLGQEPGVLMNEAKAYTEAAKAVVRDLRFRILYAEVVSINRTLGVGGTADAIIETDNGIFSVDWKTRGDDSNHGAYEEEACQVALHATADYYIVNDGGVARRVKPPAFTGGYVVSIKPDGYEVYPVDIPKATLALEGLVGSWRHKRDGQSAARKSIGKPLHITPVAAAPADRISIYSGESNERIVSDDYVSTLPADLPVPDPPHTPPPSALAAPWLVNWVVTRIAAIQQHPAAFNQLVELWPQSVPYPKVARETGYTYPEHEIDLIVETLNHVEAEHRLTFADPDPRKGEPPDLEFGPYIPPPQPIDEGGRITDTQIAKLKTILANLPAEQLAFVQDMAAEAAECGHPITMTTNPTVRRHAIALALIALAGCKDPWAANNILGAGHPDSTRLGDIVGNLTTDRALAIAKLALLTERA